jgi:hypothetical protein
MTRISSRNGARTRERDRLTDALAQGERQRAGAEAHAFGRKRKWISRKTETLAPKIYPPVKAKPQIIRHKRLGNFYPKLPVSIFRR